MTRVLWDTGVVESWLLDDAKLRFGIRKALVIFGEGRSSYLSAVTTQELMVFARLSGVPESTYTFLAEHFAPLDFSEACALEAARLLAVVSKGKSAVDLTPRMHRDAAVIATASVHQVDVFFTAAEGDFAAFVNHVPCKILAPAAVR